MDNASPTNRFARAAFARSRLSTLLAGSSRVKPLLFTKFTEHHCRHGGLVVIYTVGSSTEIMGAFVCSPLRFRKLDSAVAQHDRMQPEVILTVACAATGASKRICIEAPSDCYCASEAVLGMSNPIA